MYFSPTNQLKKFGDGDRRNRLSLRASVSLYKSEINFLGGENIFSVLVHT